MRVAKNIKLDQSIYWLDRVKVFTACLKFVLATNKKPFYFALNLNNTTQKIKIKQQERTTEKNYLICYLIFSVCVRLPSGLSAVRVQGERVELESKLGISIHFRREDAARFPQTKEKRWRRNFAEFVFMVKLF
jgi:hypothetical protein